MKIKSIEGFAADDAYHLLLAIRQAIASYRGRVTDGQVAELLTDEAEAWKMRLKEKEKR